MITFDNGYPEGRVGAHISLKNKKAQFPKIKLICFLRVQRILSKIYY